MDKAMDMSSDLVGEMDVVIKRELPKQIDFDKLMTMDEEKREIVTTIMKFSNSFREEVMNTLDSLDLIIDTREGAINEILL